MSDGKTHHKFWKAGVAPVAAASVFVGVACSPLVGAGGFVGYILGAYISPDLDLVSITSEESRMMKHFGPLGVVFAGYWLMYAYLMRFVGIGRKGHRNFFSHFPVISTVIRLVYLLILPVLIIYYFQLPLPWEYIVPTLVGVLAGLSMADTLHFILDIL